MTDVMPKIDIGRLRSLSPLHMSVKVLARYSSIFASFEGTHTCDSSSNDIYTNRTRAAAEEASYDQRRKIWCRCRRDEPDLSKPIESVRMSRNTEFGLAHTRNKI